MTLETVPETGVEEKGSEEIEETQDETINNNVEDKQKSKKQGKGKRNDDAQGRRKERQRFKAKVKCTIAELKDKVFDSTGYKQAEDYKDAKEALESYVSSNCKYGTDIRLTLEKMVKFVVPEPTMMEEDSSDSGAHKARKRRINEKRIDAFVQRENTLEENMTMVYTIIWDMCSEEMHAKLKEVNNFTRDIAEKMDPLKLLDEIRKVMYNFQEKRYTPHNILMTWIKFFELRQQPNETVLEYYERFKLNTKVVESVGGSFGRDEGMLKDAGFDTSDATKSVGDMQSAADQAKQKFLAYKFIYHADHARYGHVKDSLHSDYNKDYEKKGKKYPETMDAA